MALYPLAFPKGVKYLCEMCQGNAHWKCEFCNVTYYCCRDHQVQDWEAIHEQICPSLKTLRKPLPAFLYRKERAQREACIQAESKRLIGVSSQIARAHLFVGKAKQATLAAMQCVRFTSIVYGPNSLEHIPCYCLLAEACIGLNQIAQAEEYLAQASWSMLKAPEASAPLKSLLHRCQGRLYTAKGMTEEALREFAEDIYQSSLVFGPDHVHASGGYFYMADIFFRQGKRLAADSLYRQVTHAWYRHLHAIFKYQTRPPKLPIGVGPGIVLDEEPEVPGLDEIQKTEGQVFLTTIYELRKNQNRCPRRELMLISLALGILYFLLNDLDRAQSLGKKAVVLGLSDPHSEDSMNAVHFLQVCESSTTTH